jgi:hypothetical protein
MWNFIWNWSFSYTFVWNVELQEVLHIFLTCKIYVKINNEKGLYVNINFTCEIIISYVELEHLTIKHVEDMWTFEKPL